MAAKKVKVKVTSGDEDLGIKQNDFIILRKNKGGKIYFDEVEGLFEISNYRWEPPGNAVLSFYDEDNNAAFTIEIECNEQINKQILELMALPEEDAATANDIKTGLHYKAKNKKPIFKRWWFWVAAVLVISFVGNSIKRPDNGRSQGKGATLITSQNVEAADAVSDESSHLSLDLCIGLIESSLKESYGDNFTLTNEDSIVTVSVWGEGVALGAMSAMTGDKESLAAWKTLVESMINSTQAMQNVLNENGHGDIVVVKNVLNDINRDNLLLSITLGTVTYDVVNSINLMGVGG